MPYPNGHMYLTAHWQVMAPGIIETGQFGLRFDNTGPVTQGRVDAASIAINNFWQATNSGITSQYALSFIRLAQVDAEGKYVPGTVAYDHSYPTPINGAGGTLVYYPLQVAWVASLTTANARGRAHRGRIYLPPPSVSPNSNFQIAFGTCSTRAGTLQTMLNDLNGVMGGPLSVMSKVGTGTKLPVTGVAVGTRLDVQRSRGSSQVESYASLPLA